VVLLKKSYYNFPKKLSTYIIPFPQSSPPPPSTHTTRIPAYQSLHQWRRFRAGGGRFPMGLS